MACDYNAHGFTTKCHPVRSIPAVPSRDFAIHKASPPRSRDSEAPSSTTTDTSRPKKVYYLWNESAHPELDVSGYDVARALRAFGSKIGVIRSPCFSVDPPGRKRLVLPVASGLKYSSISIVNEASNGRAGAASEISLADFFNHAMDSRNAPTAIIVIIPADFDLIHAFTTLRMNGRELLLSCPANEGRNLLRLSEGHVLNSEILKILPAPTPSSFASTQWVAGTSPTENTAKAQSTVPRAMTALAKSPTTATNPSAPYIVAAGKGSMTTYPPVSSLTSAGKSSGDDHLEGPCLPPQALNQLKPGKKKKKGKGGRQQEEEGNKMGSKAPLHTNIPTHFVPLISVLKSRLAVSNQPVLISDLVGPLLARQPNILFHAGITSKDVPGTRSMWKKYIKAAEKAGIVLVIIDCKTQEWRVRLTPTYHPGASAPVASSVASDPQSLEGQSRSQSDRNDAVKQAETDVTVDLPTDRPPAASSVEEDTSLSATVAEPPAVNKQKTIPPPLICQSNSSAVTLPKPRAILPERMPLAGRLAIYGPDPNMHGDTLNNFRGLFLHLPSLNPAMIIHVDRVGGDFFAVELCSNAAAQEFVMIANGGTGDQVAFAYLEDIQSGPPSTTSNFNQPPPSPSQVDVPEIIVDASFTGIGFIFKSQWCSWKLKEGWSSSGRYINWAELVAIELGLRTAITMGVHSCPLRILTDSQHAINILNMHKTRNQHERIILDHILGLATAYIIQLIPVWISTKVNPADAISRQIYPPAPLRLGHEASIPYHLADFVEVAYPVVMLSPDEFVANDTTPVKPLPKPAQELHAFVPVSAGTSPLLVAGEACTQRLEAGPSSRPFDTGLFAKPPLPPPTDPISPSLEAPKVPILPSGLIETPSFVGDAHANIVLPTAAPKQSKGLSKNNPLQGRLAVYGPDAGMHGDVLNNFRDLFSRLPSMSPSMITRVTRVGGDFFAVELCSTAAARKFVTIINGSDRTDTFAYLEGVHIDPARQPKKKAPGGRPSASSSLSSNKPSELSSPALIRMAPTASTSTSPAIPRPFIPLVQHLRLLRAQGKLISTRCSLKKPLCKLDPDVFVKAGTANSKKPIRSYLSKAATSGIVIREGKGGKYSLQPAYW